MNSSRRLSSATQWIACIVMASGVSTLVGCGGGNQNGSSNAGRSVLAKSIFDTTAENQAHTFRNLDQLEMVRKIDKGITKPLPDSELAPRLTDMNTQISDYMQKNRTAGLLVLKDGKIALERYGLGNDPTSKWIGLSLTKSFVSTLVGAAVKDGRLHLTDRAGTILPELRASAYGNVTVEHLLQMQSGVEWTDDRNPKVNLIPMMNVARKNEAGGLLRYFARLPPDSWHKPGFGFNYSSADSTVLGAMVAKGTGKTLSEYLSEKIWQPAGMEAAGDFWSETANGGEFGGGGISATLRDYGRFGQFILTGAKDSNGVSILPDRWNSHGTSADPLSKFYHRNDNDLGYRYQWWVMDPLRTNRPNHAPIFLARGHMGQYIIIDRETETVAVVLSAWRPGQDAQDETFQLLETIIQRLSASPA